MFKWFDLLDNNNILVLVKTGTVSGEVLQDSYYKIMDEYRELMGTPVEFLDMIKRKIKLEIAKQELAEGNKSKLNDINMLTIDIEESKNENTISRNQELGMVAKFIGFPINPRKETIGSYCGYVLNFRANGSN